MTENGAGSFWTRYRLGLGAVLLLGLVAGAAYACLGFSGRVGDAPALAVNVPPFVRDGMVFVGDTHVHHWVLYGVLAPLAAAAGFWNVAAFSAVMTAHGLSYGDAFDFRGTRK